jgi:7-cyano-7-deazaguanine synthase
MKTLALVSGGIDSAVILWAFKPDYAVTFNYGQKHEFKETYHAEILCSEVGTKHKIINIPTAFAEVESALLKGGTKITDGKSSIIPNRNLIMLSVVAAWAATRDINIVFIGVHQTDAPVYPDCTSKFITLAQATLRASLDNENFVINAPFLNLKKSEIIKMGEFYDVPFEMTWSCYKDGPKHCGSCPACQVRKKGFEEAGLADPTEYTI